MVRTRVNLTLRLTIWVSLLVQSSQSLAALRSEAYVGEPFGVGRVTVDVLRGEPVLPLSDERFTVLAEDNRAMYPVLKQQPARQILQRLLEIESPRTVTIHYLFRGSEPFDLFPFTPVEQAVRVKPQVDPQSHRRLIDEWWKQYAGNWQRLQSDPQYPPIAENFLVATFARRLSLAVPESKRSILPWKNEQKTTAFDSLINNESHQLAVDREMLRHTEPSSLELQELPQPATWTEPPVVQTGLEDIAVEPIAAHVPHECFYIRFGNFSNYLWFRDLNKKWQGDLGNMISRRGIDRGGSERIQQQLSLRDTMLAKIMGPQVIADAAIVGLDPYMAQGAAIGILFQAKNSLLLSNDLTSQRRAALDKFSDASETTIELVGQKVSLIATPDGRVRSYYAQIGDFHFVSSSRTLAQRFLEAGQGTGALASLPSFRDARRELPVDREDNLFAFVSEKFFQNLCSPHYWVESQRRLRSTRESHLLELARQVALTEGIAATTSEELVAAGVLPAGFARRGDQSELIPSESGWIDSHRGAPGFFLSVADAPLDQVTVAEAEAYAQFLGSFRADIGQMPPLAVGVKRISKANGSGETMAIDAVLTPIAGLNIDQFKESLGPPSDSQLAPVAGDVVSVQAAVNLSVPLIGGEKEPHLLFGALQDFRSPLVVNSGEVAPGAPPAELVRGYLGAWPRPGLLQMFAGSSTAQDSQIHQAGGQLWQAQKDEFLLLSFKPEVVEQVLPQLAFEPAQRPAQIRARIEDLSGKQLAAAVNAFGYMRARETSVAASRLMNALGNQLQVPRDECRAFAERLVDGQFVCPLGGEYQLFAPDLGLETWNSSALPGANRHLLTEVPEDFQLPLLTWFRGFRGDLALDDQSLRAHLEIDMTEAAIP